MCELWSGAGRGFLIGYGQETDRNSVRISLAGELGRGRADLLDICRAQIRGMPVSSVCLDLSALDGIDEAGARSLATLCRVLRLDGLQVDVEGASLAVREEMLRLGISLGSGRAVSRSRRAADEQQTAAAGSQTPNVRRLPRQPTTPDA